PYLAQLRSEDPVHWSQAHRAWLITRYDDVVDCFRDKRLSADRVKALAAKRSKQTADDATTRSALEVLAGWMVFHDPPDHRRLRVVFNDALSPRATALMQDKIARVVEELLKPMAGSLELVQEFCY